MKTVRKLFFILLLTCLCGALAELNYERFDFYKEPMMTQGCTCYHQLSDNQQYVYRRLYRYSAAMKTTIPMLALDKEDVNIAIQAFTYDHPEFYWFSDNYCEYNDKLVVVKMPDDEKQEMATTYQKCQDKANQMIASFAYTNDYEALRCIHDAILQRVSYNTDAPFDQDVRSVLIGSETVCAGYARTFEMLCHKMGFACGYYTGASTFSTGNTRHAWNYVQVDGDMFWVDCTWDDKNTETNPSRIYEYFLISDELLYINHEKVEDEPFEAPVCSSYRYAEQTGNNPPITVTDPTILDEMVIKQLRKDSTVEIRFISQEAAQSYLDGLFAGGSDSRFVKLVREELIRYNGFEYMRSFSNDGYITITLTELE